MLALELSGPLARPVMVAMGQPGALAETMIDRVLLDREPKAAPAPTSVVTTIAHSALAVMIVSVENAHLSAPCRRAGEALPVAAPSKSIDPTKKQAILASCSLALQSRVRPSRTSGCGSTSGHRSVLV